MPQHKSLVLLQFDLRNQLAKFENCDNDQDCAHHIKEPHEEKHKNSVAPVHHIVLCLHEHHYPGVHITCNY